MNTDKFYEIPLTLVPETCKKVAKPIEHKVALNKEKVGVLCPDQNAKANAYQLSINLKLPISKIMYFLFHLELKGLV